MRNAADAKSRRVCVGQVHSFLPTQANLSISNINVFALTFVVTFCMIVTALDLILLKFLVFWHRFRGILAPRIDAWVQDGAFQLQRRAYEMQGEGIWERLDKEVPVTTYDTQLSTLPLESRPCCDCVFSQMGVKPLSMTTTMASEQSRREKKSPDLISEEFGSERADFYPASHTVTSHRDAGLTERP